MTRNNRLIKKFVQLYPAIGLFFTLSLITRPYYYADSSEYMHCILDEELGLHPHRFWEWTHLIWRPMGFAFHVILKPILEFFFKNYPFAQVSASMMVISFIVTILGIFYLYRFLRLFQLSPGTVHLVVLLYVSSQCILNYALTATSYASGEGVLIAGLYYILRDRNKPEFKNLIMGGFFLAVAALLWLPYVLALPAAFLARPIFYAPARSELKNTLLIMIFFVLTASFVFFPLALHLNLDSISSVLAWASPPHNAPPSAGFERAGLGFVKTLFYVGQEGLLIKRFFHNDPYHSASLAQLLMPSILVVLFFLFLIAALFTIISHRGLARRYGLFLGLGLFPTLIMAILRDGAALERDMPLLPFLFLAFAVWLDRTSRNGRVLFAAILIITLIVNVMAMWYPSSLRDEKNIDEKIQELWPRLNQHSVVAVVSIGDDLARFQRIFPFNRFNQSDTLNTFPIEFSGTDTTTSWKNQFNALLIREKQVGGDVWVSKTLRASYPPEWESWVENLALGVRWEDISQYFRELNYRDSTRNFLLLESNSEDDIRKQLK